MQKGVRRMKAVRNLFVGLLAAGALAGCKPAHLNETVYQFNDQQQRFQGSVNIYQRANLPFHDFAMTSPESAYYVCRANYKLRNYGQFLSCRDAFVAAVEEKSGFDKRREYLDMAYGDYLMAVGKYDQAYDVLLDIAQDWSMGFVNPFQNNGELFAGIEAPQEAVMALVMTSSFLSDPQKKNRAHQLAAKLEGDYTSGLAKFAAGKREGDMAMKALKARLAIAQKKYDKAYDYITEDYQVGLGTILNILEIGTGMDALREATGVYDKQKFNFASMYAYAAFMTGRNDVAKEKYHELIGYEIFDQQKSVNFHAYHHLGLIAQKEGDHAGAIDHMKKAVAFLESERATINSEAAKIGFVGDRQAVYRDLVATLIKAGRHAEAFEFAERGKARALVDLLASKKSFGGGQTPTQVNAMLSALEEAEMQSLQLASAGQGMSTRAASPNASIARIKNAAPEMGSLVSVTTLKAADIQARLKSNEAIVEYFYQGDGEVFAFVVGRDRVRAFTLDGDGLNKEVQGLRAAIDNYQTDDWKGWSRKLHSRLIAPLASSLTGKKHLTIVPHGALHYLPFNALRSAGGKLLIENHTVRLLPSASVMQFLDKPGRPTQNLLVFGNPNRTDADPLPGAEAEARALAKLWDGSRVILRDNASETLIKKSASAFRYIHLASHGQFDPDRPMQSRMMLSADGDNDGDLTVSEIYDLNLNADLVTLSACQTGLGDVKNGDDVVGLNRGFLYAGAKAIVASLWEVPDEPTKDLMTGFYKNLKTQDMRTALQRAQLDAYRKYQHPIAWAAFQMTGGT